jgi:hypothetical protein
VEPMTSAVPPPRPASPMVPPPLARPVPATAAPDSGPSLQDLAATERRDEISVKVAAAVAAARTAARNPEPAISPLAAAAPAARPATGPPVRTDPAPSDGAATEDSARDELKHRMIRASQARRKARKSNPASSADPALPDWYEPDLDSSNESSDAPVRSKNRR